MTNKNLAIAFAVLMCAWITYCIFKGIDICEKNKQQSGHTLPLEPDSLWWASERSGDSVLVFDSLGIKIIGHTKDQHETK